MDRKSQILLLNIIAQLLSASKTVYSWTYFNISEWTEEAVACGNTTQSPIDLRAKDAVWSPFTEQFKFINYDDPLAYAAYEILNNGHTVVTSFTNNSGGAIRISGAGLGDQVFALQQFHFHWGSQQSTGSEHTVNGDQYSMEIHLVHYNTSYGDFNTAQNKKGGLAVLGVFVLIGDYDHPTFDLIIEIFRNITYKDQKADAIHKFAIKSLLPNNTLDFYRYDGSLTTPPCYQSVIWTVFRLPIYISQRQMQEFRSLHEEPDDEPGKDEHEEIVLLVNNYRPVQPLNGRIVQRSFQNGNPDWFYDDPTSWSLYYPMCDGAYQSPIDISSSSSKPAASVASQAIPLSFSGFSYNKSITLVNTGYSVEGRLATGSAPTLAGGVLMKGTRYQLYLLSLHYSWSNDNSARGSEHSIDGTSYPLEIQLLFYNDKYTNSSQAERYSDGLAGLVIFGQVKDGVERLPILDSIANIRTSGSEYTVNSFQVDSLLPDDCCFNIFSNKSTEDWKHEYYSYNGSLTTPSCQQSVLWTVLPTPVHLPKEQMTILRSVNLTLSRSPATPQQSTNTTSSTSGNVAISNCRPAQRINSRTVLLYSQSQTAGSTKAPGSTPAGHTSAANRVLFNYRNCLLLLSAALFLFQLY